MSLKAIELIHVDVPLRKPIKHASHERTTSDNLVVRVELDGGEVGYGEGVPRPYVTGETIESTFAALAGFDGARHLGNPGDPAALMASLERLTLPETLADPRGMAGNAARCALEMALIDAYGRRFGLSAGELIRRSEVGRAVMADRTHPVRYSGAITAATDRKERVSAWKMRIYGFHQVKVKVGVDGQDDPARLRRLRRILGKALDIRIDANEAWPVAELADRVRPLLEARPSALEQPVPHAEVDQLAEIRPKLGVPIMLDESICGLPDAVAAVDRGTADILNVRLSKCGGFLPSLRIMALAAEAGLGVQLGCHPGETGLLSAAGRHLASNLKSLRYLEGSYDRHVLARNLIRGDITFGYGGRAAPLAGPGLGVEVDPEALDAMAARRQVVSYD